MADKNNELEDIATHSAGATNLHKTKTKSKKETIEAPPVPNPTRYDTRSGDYKS